jgi:hypothetical protein
MNYEKSRRSLLENMHILWQHKPSCHDYEILIHPDSQQAMEITTFKQYFSPGYHTNIKKKRARSIIICSRETGLEAGC